MDLDRLKIFVQVAEAGSLSKAAVLLDSVQSAISRQIAALETEAGRRLFDRTGRGVTLTDFGRRIFDDVKALLTEAERVEALMHGKDEVPMGEVCIGLMPSVSELVVATIFRRVREQFPAIRLRILEGSNGQLDEWVSMGRTDMSVLYRYGKTVKPGEDVLFEVDTFLVGAPGDAISGKPVVDFSELNGLPLVLPGAPNGLRIALDRLARRQGDGFVLSVVMEADSLPIQRSMASHGEAYAVHGGVVVRRDVQAGIVSAAKIVNPELKRAMVLAITTQHAVTLASKETAKILRNVVHEYASAGMFVSPTVTDQLEK